MIDIGKRPLRVGTRGSALAQAQTGQVIERLKELWPGLTVEMVIITTKGDLTLDTPLHAVGGKGLFVKEIEEALLAGAIDLAVHSAKDVPAELPAGLGLVAHPRRADPRDALIARDNLTLDRLPPGARVGSSSLRRVFQLQHLRPDLRVEPLRGNVDTRLRRLQEGRFDAVMLAAAGLGRLGLADRVTELLDPDVFIPAVGQGALALEARLDDAWTRRIAAAVHDEETALALAAERVFLARVQGGCQVPVGAHARLSGGRLVVAGFLASPDGSFFARNRVEGPAEMGQAARLGETLADLLLAEERQGRGRSRAR